MIFGKLIRALAIAIAVISAPPLAQAQQLIGSYVALLSEADHSCGIAPVRSRRNTFMLAKRHRLAREVQLLSARSAVRTEHSEIHAAKRHGDLSSRYDPGSRAAAHPAIHRSSDRRQAVEQQGRRRLDGLHGGWPRGVFASSPSRTAERRLRLSRARRRRIGAADITGARCPPCHDQRRKNRHRSFRVGHKRAYLMKRFVIVVSTNGAAAAEDQPMAAC
jgi:hypothetical protein